MVHWICTLKPLSHNPDSKVHGANVGPIWDRQDPGGPHVGPVNFAICEACVTHVAAVALFVWEGMVYGDLPYTGTLCPLPDVGRSYWMKWLIHCKYIIYVYLHVHASQTCFCPRTFFEHTGMNTMLRKCLVWCLHSKLENSIWMFWLCESLSLWCLGPWMPPVFVCRSIFDQSIPNPCKSVDKFARLVNTFSLSCKFIYW